MAMILRALAGAVRNVFHPRVLGVLLVPMLVALAVWLGLSWWFWGGWTGSIEAGLTSASDSGWSARLDLSRFAGAAATVILIMLIAPAIMVTAMLIAAVFAMPALVDHIARRDFPQLEKAKGGTFFGSLVNAVVAVAAFALLWIATLPAWLFAGPLAAIIPLLLSAYLNQRLFRYDALAEHASAHEMRRIFEERFGGFFGLGVFTGAVYFVPIVNLVAPVFAALAFICFSLGELERLRGQEKQIEGPQVP